MKFTPNPSFISQNEKIQKRENVGRFIQELRGVNDDIYIALPENIKISAKWHKEKGRKRNQQARYTDEYIGEE